MLVRVSDILSDHFELRRGLCQGDGCYLTLPLSVVIGEQAWFSQRLFSRLAPLTTSTLLRESLETCTRLRTEVKLIGLDKCSENQVHDWNRLQRQQPTPHTSIRVDGDEL